MKRYWIFVLVIVASTSTLWAYDAQIGDLYYNLNKSDKTAEVTYKTHNSSSYKYNEGWSITTANIPSSVTYNGTTYSVTSIGDWAFGDCTSLTSVTIGNSVTSIGQYAFSGCTSLPVIDNIRYADTYLVEAVDKTLSTYNIKAGTRFIGYDAFRECTSLTSVTIPNSVTSIVLGAFASCSSLTSVTIPNSVTSIGYYAFGWCNSLTSVTIPNSVTSIGYGAFYNVANIVYSGTATGSPWRARSVNGYVDGYLVYSDASKTSLLACSAAAKGDIVIPNSVTSIGSEAFRWCNSLTSITIPNSVTSIGDDAFYGCTALPVIDNIRYADTYLVEAVDKTLSTYNIKAGTRFIGNHAFNKCTGLTSVTIPNSVTRIGYEAFYGCTGLTSVTIGNSVTSIGDAAFSGCTALTSVTLNSNAITSESYEHDKNISKIFGTQVKEYVIGNSVTSIGVHAFSGCTALTSVTIPNSVTSIGWMAFGGCSGLTSIICYAVTPPECRGYSFNGVDLSIPLYVPAGSVEAYKNAYEWKDFTNILPIESATEIESAEVKATPSSSNSVSVTWPEVAGAETYTIEIKKNGVLICTLVFNAAGQLESLTFAAPARDGARNVASAMQAGNGWTYTVAGLESNTEYTYTVIAKNAGGGVLLDQTVGFKTPLPDGIEDVVSDSGAAVKTLYNGQVLIQRAGKTYTLQGQEVR